MINPLTAQFRNPNDPIAIDYKLKQLEYKLPQTKLFGKYKIQYGPNDIAAFYLYKHWQLNHRGWRTDPDRHMNCDSYTYTVAPCRSKFRTLVAEWYNNIESVFSQPKEILDNCFGTQAAYKEWVELDPNINRQVYYTGMTDLVLIMEYLPKHTPIIGSKATLPIKAELLALLAQLDK